jgi:3-oxoadipate enol-lactonase
MARRLPKLGANVPQPRVQKVCRRSPNFPEVIQATNRIFLATDMECYAATCIMLGDADLRRYLPSLRMPVAVIVGKEDYATPVATARHLHEAIPGSTLTILPGARHLTPIECPEEIAAQLLALLQRSGSVRGAQA